MDSPGEQTPWSNQAAADELALTPEAASALELVSAYERSAQQEPDDRHEARQGDGNTYDSVKQGTYEALVTMMQAKHQQDLASMRALAARIPEQHRDLAESMIEVFAQVGQLVAWESLFRVAAAFGVAQGAAAALQGLAYTIRDLLEGTALTILAFLGNPAPLVEWADQHADALSEVPTAVEGLLSDYIERLMVATPEERVILIGELAGEISAVALLAVGAGAIAPAGVAAEGTAAVSGSGELVLIGTGSTQAVSGVATTGVLVGAGQAALMEGDDKSRGNEPDKLRPGKEPIPDEGTLISAGKMSDRGGELTRAGRAFQKHSGRHPERWGDVSGPPSEVNARGQQILEELVGSPSGKWSVRRTGRYGEVVEVRLPDGRGARWSSDGRLLVGFLD